ncbi:unnamed protein product, partial [Didymodactylos carnosus]
EQYNSFYKLRQIQCETSQGEKSKSKHGNDGLLQQETIETDAMLKNKNEKSTANLLIQVFNKEKREDVFEFVEHLYKAFHFTDNSWITDRLSKQYDITKCKLIAEFELNNALDELTFIEYYCDLVDFNSEYKATILPFKYKFKKDFNEINIKKLTMHTRPFGSRSQPGQVLHGSDFSSPTSLQILSTNPHWNADGPFRMSPKLFYQNSYGIHT